MLRVCRPYSCLHILGSNFQIHRGQRILLSVRVLELSAVQLLRRSMKRSLLLLLLLLLLVLRAALRPWIVQPGRASLTLGPKSGGAWDFLPSRPRQSSATGNAQETTASTQANGIYLPTTTLAPTPNNTAHREGRFPRRLPTREPVLVAAKDWNHDDYGLDTRIRSRHSSDRQSNMDVTYGTNRQLNRHGSAPNDCSQRPLDQTTFLFRNSLRHHQTY